MIKFRNLASAVALLVAVAGCGNPGTTAANDQPTANPATPVQTPEYELKINPQEGQTFNYVTKIGGPQPVEVTTPMTVKSVSDDQVVLDTQIKNMVVNGQPAPPQAQAIFKNLVITTTMDRQGKTLSTKVSGVDEKTAKAFEGSGNAMPVGFPDHPVKVGDTWTSETNIQGKPVTMQFKLAGVKDVDGMKAAMLEASPQDDKVLKLDGPLKSSVEIATGMAIKTSATIDSNGQKVTFEMFRS